MYPSIDDDRRRMPRSGGRAAADHVRVLARDGQQQRLASPTTGRAIESTPGLQGGFIWEFWDHGLLQRVNDAKTGRAWGRRAAMPTVAR